MTLLWSLYFIGTPLCNGSTTGFDPVSRGSNPRGVTTFYNVLPHCVMVAQQVLILLVEVRILVG